MTLSTEPTPEALTEAAAWFTRLKKLDVPGEDLDAFRRWRRDPGHKEAYDVVDAFWRRSAALQLDPDIDALIASTLARTSGTPPRRRKARPVLGLGAAFAAVLVCVAVGYGAWGPRYYSTGVGEQRTIRLADGSTMMLDTDSSAAVRLSAKRREITLRRGQALFDVAHDLERPFVVEAGRTSVRALGTRFDVRRNAEGATVTLVRGSVEVRGGTGPAALVWRLAPGQRLDSQAPAATPKSVDLGSATSWTTGHLEFRGVPLRTAIDEVNRYSPERIELDAGALGDDATVGVFNIGDIDTFVSSVAELHDLKVTRPEKGVIRLSRAGVGHEGS
jgi:transmembrane sensor